VTNGQIPTYAAPPDLCDFLPHLLGRTVYAPEEFPTNLRQS
jgi:hypothetical protein